MYVKLRNRTHRPRWLNQEFFVFHILQTPFCWNPSSLYSRTINGSSWFSYCGRRKKDSCFIFDYFVVCLIFLTCPFHFNISRDCIAFWLVSTPSALKINWRTECQPASTTELYEKRRKKISSEWLCTNYSNKFLFEMPPRWGVLTLKF